MATTKSSIHPFTEEPLSSHWQSFDTLRTVKGCRRKHYRAKEVIYNEGEQANSIFIILSGMVKLISYLPNGRARIVRLHSHDQWLGLDGLTGQPYEHSAVTVGDVEVAYLPMSSFQRLEYDNPHQYCEILKQGYNDLVQADRWVSDFSTGNIKPRVVRLILFLSRIEFGEASDLVGLLRVYEMAEILGVTAESVSRVLAEFKRNKTLQLVELESGRAGVYRVDTRLLLAEISH